MSGGVRVNDDDDGRSKKDHGKCYQVAEQKDSIECKLYVLVGIIYVPQIFWKIITKLVLLLLNHGVSKVC